MVDENPTLADVVSEVETTSVLENKEPDFYQHLKRGSATAESLADLENKGIIEMRKKWSGSILFLIQAIVCFDIFLVAMYGWGGWKFDDPAVVIVVITDNFLKIIGLGLLITKSIFTKIFRHPEDHSEFWE